MTSFDVTTFRSQFPSLAAGDALFDAPGGTQTPTPVGAAIAETLTAPLSNRGTRAVSERNADRVVAEFRQAYADFLNQDPAGIVYGRSATQLTYDFSRHLSSTWGPGDEVVVTRLDHDSNVRPWVQAAKRAGATLRWVDFDPSTGELDMTGLHVVLNANTRLLAIGAASNLIGTIPDVSAAADAAHRVDALVYVDGVHYAAHELVDVRAMGADFFVCSPYKFMGPHCAVLAADPGLLETITPDKLVPSSDVVPERFEFGTLPYEIMAGATETVNFIARVGRPPAQAGSRRRDLIEAHHLIGAHERRLSARIREEITEKFGDRVVLHSQAAHRTPTVFLTFPGRHSQEVSDALVASGVHAPAGSFYAYEAFRRLEVDDEGGLRLGVAPYTSDDDVDRLLEALTGVLAEGPAQNSS